LLQSRPKECRDQKGKGKVAVRVSNFFGYWPTKGVMLIP
jgi:hypothetical protein